ncbi:MAG: AMP-binding protein, partial [Stellaceae bacterium]
MHHPSHFATTQPDKPAIVMPGSGEVVTYRELNERAMRGAQMFRAFGLRTGDHIAVMIENRPAYHELYWAAQRAGLYFTPVSTRLTAGEIEYILENSGAKLFIASRRMASALNGVAMPDGVRGLMLDDAVPGFDSFETTAARCPAEPLEEQIGGAIMFYSSGTTGRPKGVKRPMTGEPFDAPVLGYQLYKKFYGFDENTIYLSPAPLYHAAPLVFTNSVLSWGGTIVVMDKFDAEQSLMLIERHRVTASQWVPTMFVRMLRLPETVKRKYDLSSHRVAIHAAAPCPVEIKRQMIYWWGPVLHEYYAGSEGNGFVIIDSNDWLAHPGSVGRAVLG